MSQPFIGKIAELMKQRTPAELVTGAIAKMEAWAMKSTSGQVSLDEVAWIAAVLLAANPRTAEDIKRRTNIDLHGSRVIEVVATSSTKTSDGAG